MSLMSLLLWYIKARRLPIVFPCLLVGKKRVTRSELRVPGNQDRGKHWGLHPLVVVGVDADLIETQGNMDSVL